MGFPCHSSSAKTLLLLITTYTYFSTYYCYIILRGLSVRCERAASTHNYPSKHFIIHSINYLNNTSLATHDVTTMNVSSMKSPGNLIWNGLGFPPVKLLSYCYIILRYLASVLLCVSICFLDRPWCWDQQCPQSSG